MKIPTKSANKAQGKAAPTLEIPTAPNTIQTMPDTLPGGFLFMYISTLFLVFLSR